MFGDWTTVLAAYNCGRAPCAADHSEPDINSSTTSGSVRASGPRKPAGTCPDSWPRCRSSISPREYGLNDVVVDHPWRGEIVTIHGRASLAAIARSTGIETICCGCSIAELRQGVLPEDGYDLRVPSGEKNQVLAKLDDILLTRLAKRRARPWSATSPQGRNASRPFPKSTEPMRKASCWRITCAPPPRWRRDDSPSAHRMPPGRSPTLPEPKVTTAKRENDRACGPPGGLGLQPGETLRHHHEEIQRRTV